MLQTVRKEGVAGLYKGATPPLVGWMMMDSVWVLFWSTCGRMKADSGGCRMLGSLTLYRRLLLEHVFSNPRLRSAMPFTGNQRDLRTLPSVGHGVAGIMAGTTVSFIAAPVEHIKARLQIQYAADKSQRMYSGPVDCLVKLVSYCPARSPCEANRLTRHSSARTAFPGSIAGSARPSSSARSSFSGGARTTSSRD